MKRIHAREKEQFIKLLRQEGVDAVDRRFRLFEAFLNTEQHVTADELLSILQKQGMVADLEFVRETLQLMVHYGFAEEKRFDDGRPRFEHRHIGLHHDHLICSKCRRIIEFTDDRLERRQLEIAGEYGFHMLLHKMEIYGICADCLSRQAELVSLDQAKPGDRLVIREYAGGMKLNMKLVHMGLRIGDVIEVITNSGRGQVVVAADYSRYVLGKGMAQKIMVEPVSP